MKLSESKFFEMDDIVSEMPYQIGDNFDSWYPTREEIDHRIDLNSEEGIRFLLWITHPRDAKLLTKEQKSTMNYAKRLLYNINLND